MTLRLIVMPLSGSVKRVGKECAEKGKRWRVNKQRTGSLLSIGNSSVQATVACSGETPESFYFQCCTGHLPPACARFIAQAQCRKA